MMRTIVKKIGTAPEADIQINGEGIKEIHARISINEDKEVYIADTGSDIGTMLNGKQL